jgi:hypothetical protein
LNSNPVGGILKTVAATSAATAAVTSTITTFNFHLGSTGCVPPRLDAAGAVVKDAAGNTVYTCSNPNVQWTSALAVIQHASTQKVALDIGQLFWHHRHHPGKRRRRGLHVGRHRSRMPDHVLCNCRSASAAAQPVCRSTGGAAQQIFKAVAK